MTTTTAERKQNQQQALDILENLRDTLTAPSALLIISADLGKGVTDYFRVAVPNVDTYSKQGYLSHLTWAFAIYFGYRLRDKNGYNYLSINGGNFNKPDEIARTLANFYGVERIRYEVL
jgi:hypothetical protein